MGWDSCRRETISSLRSALPLLPTPLFLDCLLFLPFISLHIPGEVSAVFQRFIPIKSYWVVTWQPASSFTPEMVSKTSFSFTLTGNN